MRKKAIKKATYIMGSMSIGMLISFGGAQILWLLSAANRVDSYASSILNHAETVANNLTSALDDLNNIQGEKCDTSTLSIIRKITYEYRFVKDAGVISGAEISCSAMWGDISPIFPLENGGRLTDNGIRLWSGVSGYFPGNGKIEMAAKEKHFVVTSPTAFAPYESPPPELSSTVTARNSSLVMRKFGIPQDANLLTTASSRVCSNKYDICVESVIAANILANKGFGLIFFTGTFGACLGLLGYYALYQSERGRNSFSHRLKLAISNNSISTAYQPIVYGATGQTVGFEVLARWHDKKLGHVSPPEFIQQAEKLGLQGELNQLIVKRSFDECSEALIRNPDLYLSFNVGTQDLLDGSLLNYISRTASTHQIATRQVAIEILEGATAEISKIEASINRLRSVGHKVLIDDFGSGYSSLSYLASLNVDIIKIDRSFTQSAGTESPAAIVLQKVFEIASALHAKIIFEGVETEAQKEAILALCPDALVQGWLFSKALCISELTKKIETEAAGAPVLFAPE